LNLTTSEVVTAKFWSFNLYVNAILRLLNYDAMLPVNSLTF
jgi:hypothetical protein